MNKFYVYALLDPRKPGVFSYRGSQIFDHEPFYIGKGKGRRCFEHLGQIKNAKKESTFKANKIRRIFLESNQEPIIVKLQEDLFEEQAFAIESFLIQQIGRKDLTRGPLTNLTDGGDGSTLNISEITRRKLTIILKKRWEDPEKRKIQSIHVRAGWDDPEKRRKQCDLQKRRWDDPEKRKELSILFQGEKNPFFGKKHTVEDKQKISESHKGKKLSEDTKKKMSLAFSGENHPMFGRRGKDNPNFGRKRTEEEKKKMREAWKRRKLLARIDSEPGQN